MSDDRLRVEAATWADAPAIRTVLARAYRENPLMCWVLPDDATREDACAGWLGPSVDRYLALGVVHVARLDDRVVGAAAWRRPHTTVGHPVSESLPRPGGVLAALVGAQRSREVLDALGGSAAFAPTEPAAYLNYLAVDPELHGRGIGARLVAAGHVELDGPTWLGTTDPRNLPFYRRQGYVPVGEVALGDDGPVLAVLHRGTAWVQELGGSANQTTVSP